MAVKVKKIALTLLGLVLILAVIYSDILIYGLRQGKGQMDILLKAKPIEEVLLDESFPDSLKQKIELVQEIRRYAIDSLGLANSDNYTTLFDQKGKPILWVVNACPPYSLDEYKWDYPFLGELGYKGFFEKKLAEEEQERLKKEGYDTEIGTVSGWSTLGWFKDPILSNMLYRSEGRLADLIIHELTHATLFVKGDAKFNENLATFIGNNGAIKFLEYKYGLGSEELESYTNSMYDSKLFAQHLNKGAKELEALYTSFENIDSLEEKDKQKNDAILSIFKSADTLSLKNYKKKNLIEKFKKELPNNTFFTSYRMYYDSQADIKKQFDTDFNGDFGLFLEAMKEKYGNSSVND